MQTTLLVANLLLVVGTFILGAITLGYALSTRHIGRKTAEAAEAARDSATAAKDMATIERERHDQERMAHPRLEVTTSGKPPDCHVIPVNVTVPDPLGREPTSLRVPCCYLRVRVRNVGRVSAERVEVYLAELQRSQKHGSYNRDDSFSSRPLKWAYMGGVTLANLHPDIGLYCDVAQVVDPRIRFGDGPALPAGAPTLLLELEWKSTRADHYLLPGRYRLVLLAAAADMPPLKTVLELNYTGEWYATEEEMLEKGVTLRVVPDA